MAKMQLRKAERKRAKLRIGIVGPSGSGKTFSALRLARGLADTWDRVAIIDTEHRSADLYSHLGEYNVLTLDAPFSPERYIEAIKTCEDAGIQAIIVDSITHEWEGQGGCLEIVAALTKASPAKNSYTVWEKVTPRHNAFINAILGSSAHVICCVRTKVGYAINEVEKNGRKVSVPEKMGLKAITREGFDYEMTVAFDLAINHLATASKDRTGLFMDQPDFLISEETGHTFLTWNEEASEPVESNVGEKSRIAALIAGAATLNELREVWKAEITPIQKANPALHKELSEAGVARSNELTKTATSENKPSSNADDKADEDQVLGGSVEGAASSLNNVGSGALAAAKESFADAETGENKPTEGELVAA